MGLSYQLLFCYLIESTCMGKVPLRLVFPLGLGLFIQLLQYQLFVMASSMKQIFSEVTDEESAIIFLQEKGLLPVEKLCDKGHFMKLCVRTTKWRCCLRSCRSSVGLRVGTWFQRSRMPLHTAVQFIFCWCQELTSIDFCKTNLQLCNKTAIDWNNYLREVCVWTLKKSSEVIGGVGKHVEIDKSSFVRRKLNTGKKLPEQWVFGGLCRETNECFITLVPDESEDTLLKVIQERIAPGTTIISNCWKEYRNLDEEGYHHLTVDQKYNFVGPDSSANSRCIEMLCGSVDWGNKKRRGTERHLLDSYLAEFIWRRKVKERKLDLFETMLSEMKDFWEEIVINSNSTLK